MNIDRMVTLRICRRVLEVSVWWNREGHGPPEWAYNTRIGIVQAMALLDVFAMNNQICQERGLDGNHYGATPAIEALRDWAMAELQIATATAEEENMRALYDMACQNPHNPHNTNEIIREISRLLGEQL
jgi:hypothetical protein